MDSNIADHVSIDVENLATCLRSELGTLLPLSNEACIFRAPKQTRQGDEKGYTPRIVSIGPFHHENKDLKAMEEIKRRYLEFFLQRTEVSLEDFLKCVKKKEAKIRRSYSEVIGFNSDVFVKMILIDAIFLIEVFLRYHFFDTCNSGDPIYDRTWRIIDVKHDIWLLENQLPFFILEDLFKLATISLSSNTNEGLSLVKLVQEICMYYLDFFGVEKDKLDEVKYSSALNLVDFLKILITPLECQQQDRFNNLITTPSVTELHQAGVKFKPRASSKSLFDVRFQKGVLEIPQITIRPSMVVLLKNLLAFEKCHSYDSFISEYIFLISYLADTAKDVDLLLQNGIIHHRLRNNEAVSTLFHDFVEGFRPDIREFYFTSLVANLNDYCRNPLHKKKANLKQEYLKNPWATASVIAAVILLILTFIQTVCSILQVHNP